MFCDGGGDRVYVGKGFFGGGRVGNFEAVVFFKGDDELKSVYGVQAKAAGPKEGKIVRNFLGLLLEHEVLDEEFSYFGFKLVDVVHVRSLKCESGGCRRSGPRTSRKL